MPARSGRPRTPDAAIIEGARRALIANPRASMTEIARAAGVGMSAIYLRFPNRDALLQGFADEANRVYDDALDRVDADLASGEHPGAVLERFMTAIAESGVHRLGLAIAGTFQRSADDLAESLRLRDRGREFVASLHTARALRPGTTWEDIGKTIEAVSSLEGADAERSATLRRRMVDIVVTGLTSGSVPLTGSTAEGIDFLENRSPA